MDNSYVTGVAMAVVGAGLGVFFFGGLWLTLKNLPDSKHPYLLTLSSAIVRTTVVIGGIWYFAAGDPVGIAAVLGGFIAIQLLATYRGSVNTDVQRRLPR